MDLFQILIILPIAVFIISIPMGWFLGSVIKKIWIISEEKSWSNKNTIYSEYSPPNNLRPAEIAYLYDKSFGEEELLATLFDLENRHVIELLSLGKNQMITDFKINLLTEPMNKKLSEFEQEVMLTLFSLGENAKWSVLIADSSIWDSNIENKLELDLIKKDLIKSPNSKLTTVMYLLIGALSSGIIMYLATQLIGTNEINNSSDPFNSLKQGITNFVLFFMWFIASIFYSLAAYFGISAFYNASDFTRGTYKLNLLWPHLAGFRYYLKVVEQDIIKFENETLREDSRNNALPYAVALNLTTRWEKRFN